MENGGRSLDGFTALRGGVAFMMVDVVPLLVLVEPSTSRERARHR